jgi:hypothetical protein
LDRIGGHARAPVKPHESGAYDSSGVGYLSCTRGSWISCLDGGIRCGMSSVLQARIRCAITPISLLSIEVLWPVAASLDPLGILHMAAFVTLCEAYMGIEPHCILWNYFRAQLQQGLDAKGASLGNVDIFVRSRPGVDPYFHLPMSNPSVRQRRAWFILRNNDDVPLLMFTGSRSSPNPTGGTVWLKRTFDAIAHAGDHLGIAIRRTDGRGDSADLFQL